MRKILVLLLMFISFTSLHAQLLEDVAKSMNSQSPSGWINGTFRMLGASYISKNFTMKIEYGIGKYFETEAQNRHPKESKILFGYLIAQLSKNELFNAIFYTIIQEHSDFTFVISTSDSSEKAVLRYKPNELTDIISNYASLSRENISIRAHVVGTTIGCPNYLDTGLWMDKCELVRRRIVYHVSYDVPDYSTFSTDNLSTRCKKLFWGSMIAFPEIENLVQACITTNHQICWRVHDSRTKRELFSILYGQEELKLLQKIIKETN